MITDEQLIKWRLIDAERQQGRWDWEPTRSGPEWDEPATKFPYVPQGAVLGPTMIRLADTYETSLADCAFLSMATEIVPLLLDALINERVARRGSDNFSQRALEENAILKAERDAAREELALIRQAVNADGGESTFDEVVRVVGELHGALESMSALAALLQEWRATPFFESQEDWQRWVSEFSPRVDAALRESDGAWLERTARAYDEARQPPVRAHVTGSVDVGTSYSRLSSILAEVVGEFVAARSARMMLAETSARLMRHAVLQRLMEAIGDPKTLDTIVCQMYEIRAEDIARQAVV